MNTEKIKRNSFCRLCLRRHNHLMNIFEDNDEDQNDISTYIYLFFAVKITRGDYFSTHVCKPCWDIIVSTCKNRIEYRNNDSRLRNYDGQTPFPIKFEAQDPVNKTRHKSVDNIIEKYSGIILEPDLWNFNFEPTVNLSRSRVSLHPPHLPVLIPIFKNLKEPSAKNSECKKDTICRASLHSPEVPNLPNLSEVRHLPNLSEVPNLPNLSEVRHLPNLSEVPNLPNLPEVPHLPHLSEVTKMRQIRKIPNLPKVSHLPVLPESHIPVLPESHISVLPESHIPVLPDSPQMSKNLKESPPKISKWERDPDFKVHTSPYKYKSYKRKNTSTYKSNKRKRRPRIDIDFTDDDEEEDVETTERNKRHSRRPRIFGSPLYIPDNNEFEDFSLEYYGN